MAGRAYMWHVVVEVQIMIDNRVVYMIELQEMLE